MDRRAFLRLSRDLALLALLPDGALAAALARAPEAGVPEYIDLMLGMFERSPVPLFAGGPFSLRDGGGPNAFADFLALDAIDERVWRTRIEGSRGLPEREWNGPVVGLQETYATGLAHGEVQARRGPLPLAPRAAG